MITLQRPDIKASAFLGEKRGIRHGDGIRPSQFTMALHLGSRCVIFNTLTKQCIESKYFEWFEYPKERSFDENDDEMLALVNRDFLVKSDLNEADRYYRLIKVIRKTEKPEAGYVGYTILPTTACNARCVYCYEEGISYETMSDETVEQVIKYIKRTRREESTVRLHWFGGEPLMGEKVIDRICEAMKEAEIDYSSNMISNGSLMTKELAHKAREEWHLKNVQITLDGREDVYCARKRYVSFDGSPFRTVLDGIHAMMNQKIRVSIRLNVDEGNLDELMLLADELEEEFKSDSLVSIYCHSIFAENDEDIGRDSTALYDGMKKLDERLYEFNKNRQNQHDEEELLSQEELDDANIEWETDRDRCPDEEESAGIKYYDRRSAMKRYYCMFDNPIAGPAILPDGSMRLCEHIVDCPPVGTIYDEALIDREAFIKRDRETNKKCLSCALLPVCTDFTSCPTRDRDCAKEIAAMEKRKLRNLESEDRLPPVTVAHEGKIIRIVEPTPEFAERCTAILAADYLKADDTITQAEAELLF